MDATNVLILPSSSSSPSPSLHHPSSSSASTQPPPPTSPPPTRPSPPTPPIITYHIGISIANAATAEMRDEAWSCLMILVTFWFFASMTLILGLYGSAELVLGPNCSRLLRANSLFVQDIKVKADEDSKQGPVLYGFLGPPPLDVQSVWSESHNVSIPVDFHKEWIYYLNKGARIEVSYSVKSEVSFPLILVIAQGKENLLQWIEDPSRPNTTLSWSLVHGDGTIEQNISRFSDYYIAVGNLNQLEMEVQLSFRIQNSLYNTSGAYYRCSLDHKQCVLKLLLSRANFGVLTTPARIPTSKNDEWYVKLSYGPRWVTYFVGSGIMTVVILLAFNIVTNIHFISGNGATHQTSEVTTERSPLLSNKDDDNLSLGSSYESVSNDEDDTGEILPGSKLLKDGEINDSQHVCTICCDAKKDCFFLPCGHCAVCFTCGTRILDEAGTCPICRRKMKKVRKIFTV